MPSELSRGERPTLAKCWRQAARWWASPTGLDQPSDARRKHKLAFVSKILHRDSPGPKKGHVPARNHHPSFLFSSLLFWEAFQGRVKKKVAVLSFSHKLNWRLRAPLTDSQLASKILLVDFLLLITSLFSRAGESSNCWSGASVHLVAHHRDQVTRPSPWVALWIGGGACTAGNGISGR